MHLLQEQPLLHFQKQLHHVEYILIDEISFIGLKMLSRIDDRLREALPLHRNAPFDNHSIIFVGDLGQLLPMKDIPLYVGTSCGTALWCNFDTFITLSIVFCQRGANLSQVTFRQILKNLINGTPTLEDRNILISR